MKIKDHSLKYLGKFEVYLEGIKVPFDSIQIAEAEDTIPSAVITFNGVPQVIRLLPATIIQIFGNTLNPYLNKSEQCLLFEGEITAINYGRTPNGQQISLRATSLLQHMIKARIRPSDVIITRQQKEAEVTTNTNAIIKTDKVSENNPAGLFTPLPAYRFKDLIQRKKEKDDFKSITGKVSELGNITTLGKLADEFAGFLTDDNVAGKGNYLPIIEKFNSYFEKNDLYYGITSLSFQLGNSLFAFPNPNMSTAYKLRCTLEAIQNITQYSMADMIGGDQQYTLMQMLNEFQKYLHYRLIAPAAPPAVKMFYKNVDMETYLPMRASYLPKFESGPPALCNVFFPEQITSVNYQRDMVSEPTRLIAQASFQKIGAPSFINPIQVVPDLGVENIKGEGVVSRFSDEETYRGVTLKASQFDGILSQVFYKDSRKINTETGKIESTETTADSMNTNLGQTIRDFALDEYLTLRYQTRVVTLQGEWNPYRMIGLPALVFSVGKPSLVGIINSIQTNITATGNAVSSVTMRNCRIILDEEESSPFYNDPQEDVSSDSLEQFVIDDLSQEGISAANELLYNAFFYGFETIGEDIYAYLLDGNSGHGRKFEKLATDAGFSTIWKDYETNLKSTAFPNSRFADHSILKFIKTNASTEAGKIKFKDEFIAKATNWGTGLPKEIYYTKLLFLSIGELKKQYSIIKKSEKEGETLLPPIFQFANSLNWRRIIDKKTYLSFIGAINNENDLYADSKDLISILSTIGSSQKNYYNQKLRAIIKDLGEQRKNTVEANNTYTELSYLDELENLKSIRKDIQSMKLLLTELKNKTVVAYAIEKARNAGKYNGNLETFINSYKTENEIKNQNNLNTFLNKFPALKNKQSAFSEQYMFFLKQMENYYTIKNTYPDKIKEFEDKVTQLEEQTKEIDKEKGKTVKEKISKMRDLSALFRPYNITRKAHVHFIFNNMKKIQNSSSSLNNQIIVET